MGSQSSRLTALRAGQVIEAQGRRNTEVEALVFLTEQNRDWHRNEAERLGAQLAARDEHIARTGSRWWFRLGRGLRLL